MSPAVKIISLALAGILIASTALAQQPGSRRIYDFKRLDTGLGLSQAQLMYQAENDLLGQRTNVTSTATNNITNNSTTAAESLTNITTDCGNDALARSMPPSAVPGRGHSRRASHMGTGTQTGAGTTARTGKTRIQHHETYQTALIPCSWPFCCRGPPAAHRGRAAEIMQYQDWTLACEGAKQSSA